MSVTHTVGNGSYGQNDRVVPVPVPVLVYKRIPAELPRYNLLHECVQHVP